MNALGIFVRNPIFTVMINLALAMVGLFSYFRLDVDLFPIFADEAQELLPQLGGALRQWVARPDNVMLLVVVYRHDALISNPWATEST